MLENLPQEFIDETTKIARQPISLCHFIFQNITIYLSDIEVGIADGLDHQYYPLIEDWGKIKDMVRPRSIFEGNSLGIKSGTITIINSIGDETIANIFRRYGIENTIVEYYQWFKTEDGSFVEPQLIDAFLVRDPIVMDQKSMLVSLDLVSPLIRSNAYLWGKEEDKGTRYPYIVGKALGVPLIDLQTSRITTLTEDIEFDATGNILIENAIGFPTSGVLTIDSEHMEFDSRTNLSFNITSRGYGGTIARPHIRGSKVFIKDSVFEYAVCRGPIQKISELRGDDQEYAHPYESFPGSDPVILKFTGWPPYHTSVAGDPGPPIPGEPTDTTQYGVSTESFYGDGATAPTGVDNINLPSGAASLNISHVISDRVPISFTMTSGNGDSQAGDCCMYANATSILLHAWGDAAGATVPNDGNVSRAWIQFNFPYNDVEVNYVQVNFNQEFIACLGCGTEGTVEMYLNTTPGIDDFTSWYIYKGGGTGCYEFFEDGVLSQNYSPIEAQNVTVRLNTRADWAYSGMWDPNASSGSQVYNISVRVEGTIPYQGEMIYPYQELCSHFNRDLSNMGTLNQVLCKVKFSLQISNATVDTHILYRHTKSDIDNRVLWSETNNFDQPSREIEVGVSARDWTELQSLRVGIRNTFTGNELGNRVCNCVFESVTWIINYTPFDTPTPDEERMLYVKDLVADVVSLEGEDLTPPEVARNLIMTYSQEGNRVDQAVFDEYKQKYIDSNYYLNGIIPGDHRFQDALKSVLHEGAMQLKFNQGMIRMTSFHDSDLKQTDYTVEENEVAFRSFVQRQEPTEYMANEITITYDKEYETNSYKEQITVSNDDSISRFGYMEKRFNYDLIHDEETAQMIVDFLIAEYSKPISILSFEMFMSGFILEKGDTLLLQKGYSGEGVLGQILNITRTYGKGKTKTINKFKVELSKPNSTIFQLGLIQGLKIDDIGIEVKIGRLLVHDFVDSLSVDDSDILFGTGTALEYGFEESLIIDDSDIVFKLPISAFVMESLAMDDSEIEIIAASGYGASPYGAAPYGD